jgi:hypothetical protein
LEVNEWVSNLAETNYHSFTSKNEIMELISMKLNESDSHEFGPNVKTGHNGLPEFMTYDAITSSQTAPTIAPPKTKPGTTPKKTPFRPGPAVNPKPKAGVGADLNEVSTETMEQKTAPTIAPPKTKPGTTPKKTPFRPGPAVNPKPKALKEDK